MGQRGKRRKSGGLRGGPRSRRDQTFGVTIPRSGTGGIVTARNTTGYRDLMTKLEASRVYEEWVALGRPTVKRAPEMKRNGTRKGYSTSVAAVRAAAARADDAAVARALENTVSAYGARTIPLLVGVLKGNYGMAAKHVAALAVRDLSAQAAVPALFGVIRSRRFRDRRGTFVYALGTLDWRRYARQLANLIADATYEVRAMAVQALESDAGRHLTRAQRRSMINALLRSLYGGKIDDDTRSAIAYALNLLIDQEAGLPAKLAKA